MTVSGDYEKNDKRTRFEAIAMPFLKDVHNAALRLSRDGEEARDLAQETYLRAYRTFENFRPGTNCKAWLLTILYSIFINRYRKRQREPKTVSVEEMEEKSHRLLAAQEVDPSPSGWTDREIEKALGDLPERFRSVAVMVDVEELSYEEAAAVLGCPVGTVRSRLFRARRLLSVALKDYAHKAGYLKGTGESQS